MPPKPVAEVASLTVTPDLVWSPWPPFSAGAHAASATTTSADAAVAARSRDVFMGEAFRWAGGGAQHRCNANICQVNVTIPVRTRWGWVARALLRHPGGPYVRTCRPHPRRLCD